MIGTGPQEVSASDFVAEYNRAERVYFGELKNWMYLIPRGRRAEKKMQRNDEVWYTNINELPAGTASRLRTRQSKSEGGR